MALGYSLGKVYTESYDPAKRKKFLIAAWSGSDCLIYSIAIHKYCMVIHSSWSRQSTATFTFLSFLKVSKYPPSFLYLLITLGPAILFLAFTETQKAGFSAQIKMIGRVPMFYYIVHIYIIHTCAMVATYFAVTMERYDSYNWISFEPKLQGYGFSLGVYINMVQPYSNLIFPMQVVRKV